jgi:hypothetical protein
LSPLADLRLLRDDGDSAIGHEADRRGRLGRTRRRPARDGTARAGDSAGERRDPKGTGAACARAVSVVPRSLPAACRRRARDRLRGCGVPSRTSRSSPFIAVSM